MITSNNDIKLIDFGNSEFFFDNHDHIYCHFEGTFQYMPPEYFDLGKFLKLQILMKD